MPEVAWAFSEEPELPRVVKATRFDASLASYEEHSKLLGSHGNQCNSTL